jgi:hypothetical protein
LTPEQNGNTISLAKMRGGAGAFSRTGDPATGDFSDGTVIAKFGAMCRMI